MQCLVSQPFVQFGHRMNPWDVNREIHSDFESRALVKGVSASPKGLNELNALLANHNMHATPRSLIFTVRKRSCGKVMVSQACVKNSVHRGEVVYIPEADTPRRPTPPLADTTPSLSRHPPRQTPHLSRHPSRRPLQRAVRILLECILVHRKNASNVD